jgi:hypothetical protein
MQTNNQPLRISRDCLNEMLDDCEYYVADGGYRDGNQYADTPNGLNNADQLMKAIARARHETANSCFKRWGILEQRYRHTLSKHGSDCQHHANAD